MTSWVKVNSFLQAVHGGVGWRATPPEQGFIKLHIYVQKDISHPRAVICHALCCGPGNQKGYPREWQPRGPSGIISVQCGNCIVKCSGLGVNNMEKTENKNKNKAKQNKNGTQLALHLHCSNPQIFSSFLHYKAEYICRSKLVKSSEIGNSGYLHVGL